MRGALLAGLALLALAGCGQTYYRPPNLGAPRAEAADPGQTPVKLGNLVLSPAYTQASGCGVERWAQKTLTDPAANQVNLTPVPSTVAALRALPPPVSPTDRVAPVETSTYQLSGTIVFAKQEADGDIHLVLEDASGQTLIVEAADPACASGSLVLSQITAVRQAVQAKFGAVASAPYTPTASYTVNAAVTVTGVGFFDRLHGQTGVAPNGIELHPLTSITFSSGVKAARPVPDLHLRENPGTD